MRIGDEMHPRISFSRSGFSTPTGSDHQINASPIQEMGTSLLNDTLAITGKIDENTWSVYSNSLRQAFSIIKISNPPAGNTWISLPKHSNIISAYMNFASYGKNYLLIENFGCSFGKFIRENNINLDTEIGIEYIQTVYLAIIQLINALQFAHDNNIYHGNINLDNIYIQKNQSKGYNHIKLTNFLEKSPQISNIRLLSLSGSPNTSPQRGRKNALRKGHRHSLEKDVYYLGVCILELMHGHRISPKKANIQELPEQWFKLSECNFLLQAIAECINIHSESSLEKIKQLFLHNSIAFSIKWLNECQFPLEMGTSVMIDESFHQNNQGTSKENVIQMVSYSELKGSLLSKQNKNITIEYWLHEHQDQKAYAYEKNIIKKWEDLRYFEGVYELFSNMNMLIGKLRSAEITVEDYLCELESLPHFTPSHLLFLGFSKAIYGWRDSAFNILSLLFNNIAKYEFSLHPSIYDMAEKAFYEMQLRKQKFQRNIRFDMHNSPIQGIGNSPNGTYFVTVSSHEFHIWSLNPCEHIYSYENVEISQLSLQSEERDQNMSSNHQIGNILIALDNSCKRIALYKMGDKYLTLFSISKHLIRQIGNEGKTRIIKLSTFQEETVKLTKEQKKIQQNPHEEVEMVSKYEHTLEQLTADNSFIREMVFDNTLDILHVLCEQRDAGEFLRLDICGKTGTILKEIASPKAFSDDWLLNPNLKILCSEVYKREIDLGHFAKVTENTNNLLAIYSASEELLSIFDITNGVFQRRHHVSFDPNLVQTDNIFGKCSFNISDFLITKDSKYLIVAQGNSIFCQSLQIAPQLWDILVPNLSEFITSGFDTTDFEADHLAKLQTLAYNINENKNEIIFHLHQGFHFQTLFTNTDFLCIYHEIANNSHIKKEIIGVQNIHKMGLFYEFKKENEDKIDSLCLIELSKESHFLITINGIIYVFNTLQRFAQYSIQTEGFSFYEYCRFKEYTLIALVHLNTITVYKLSLKDYSLISSKKMSERIEQISLFWNKTPYREDQYNENVFILAATSVELALFDQKFLQIETIKLEAGGIENPRLLGMSEYGIISVEANSTIYHWRHEIRGLRPQIIPVDTNEIRIICLKEKSLAISYENTKVLCIPNIDAPIEGPQILSLQKRDPSVASQLFMDSQTKFLFAAFEDNWIIIWNSLTGSAIFTHYIANSFICVDNNSQILASLSPTFEAIELWNIEFIFKLNVERSVEWLKARAVLSGGDTVSLRQSMMHNSPHKLLEAPVATKRKTGCCYII